MFIIIWPRHTSFRTMPLIALIPIAISLCLVLVFRFINKKYNPPIFGVYQRRNKWFWFKFLFMYIVLRYRQLLVHLKRTLAVELGYSYDGTVHIHEHDVALEQKFFHGDHPLAVDAVYFNGTSKDTSVICGIARRPQNICDAFMFLKLAGKDRLLTLGLPDTYLQQEPVEEGEYAVNGMAAHNFIPMRAWKLSYSGEMKSSSDPEKKHRVEMSLTWSAKFPVFNFDSHMSPRTMAKDIARERWSNDYFKLLKKFHQTHYEQMGHLSGSVFVDGEEHKVNIPCVRDHSFGAIRDWRNFHRYVLHFIFLENGDCIQVGVVCQPTILSHLTIGYLCRRSDQAVFPLTYCDFQMWQHGENQVLPRDYGFVFKAGGESYDVKIKVEDEDTFYMGKHRVAKLYERWGPAEVNGVKGWACGEWDYYNVATSINGK